MISREKIWNSNREMIFMVPWLLLFFTLPVFPLLVPACVLMILLTLPFRWTELTWKFREWPLLILPVVLYLLYIVGLHWTETEGMAATVVERKLSFLIFPLLFLVIPQFSKLQRNIFFRVFVSGAFLHSVISLTLSLFCYLNEGNTDCFFSSAFSFLLHPSYSAMYDVFAIAWLGINLIDKADELSPKQKAFRLFEIAWFVVIILFLASKAGIISLAIVALLLMIYFSIRRKKIKQTLIVFLIALGLGASSMLITSVPLERFQAVFANSGLSEQELFEKHRTSAESNVIRRMIWICAKEVIRENPYGVGSGDANTELMNKYKDKGMSFAIERELNAHNQYFQIAMALGIQGLILFSVIVLGGFIYAFRRRNFIFLLFLIVVAINLSVESMFETQAGIVFIVLFYCFLYTGSDSVKIKSSIHNPDDRNI